MDLLVRLILIVIGLACAILAGLVFLPIASFFDPVTREEGMAVTLFGILSIVSAALISQEPERVAGTFLLLVWTITIAICFAPVIVTALLGEVARVRSWIWYVLTPGIVSAAVPYIARAGHARRAGNAEAGPAEPRFMLLFFLTGVVSGLVYWLIAGRGAGASERA